MRTMKNKIFFCKKIYKKESIEKTAEEFVNACETQIKDLGGYYEIVLTPKQDIEIKELKGEFCNHCLCV